ncbi:restriction endonuclease subunit S [Helicobacter felis]|uniref:restriction endonuclease subunit S n=1 Tax=Helicobacter felis TaxID=214 RepID=UPI0013154338|nr:restriction endonuclease subunit S [Helicobacter felis]
MDHSSLKHPLEKLLQEHCPQGVEFAPLKEVCALRTGERITTKEMRDDAPYPVWGGGTQPTGHYHAYNFEESITIARAGSAGHVGFQEGKFWATDVCFVAIKKEDMPALIKFVFYVLKNNQNKLRANLYGATMPKLDKGVLYDFPIPLPPLIVQEKIVSILDCFTELTAELTARKKQYSHYLNALLDFGTPTSPKLGHHALLKESFRVEWSKIEDFATCFTGATPSTSQKEFWENGTIPWMSSGEVNFKTITTTQKKITEAGYKSCNTKMLPIGSVVIALAGQGKTRGLVAVTQIELCTNQSLCGIVVEPEKINHRYLYHYLTSQYRQLRQISCLDGFRGGLTLKMIRDFVVPLPPLALQAKIVEILDQFNALTTDLQEGLPAEIKAREKQYTHYLNTLLDFGVATGGGGGNP